MMALNTLVQEFVEGVLGQKQALAEQDADLGNLFANKYIRAWRQLRSYGDEGREALAVLLNDVRVDVRVMAAGFLLKYRTTEAMAILREAEEGHGIASLDAQQVLRRWQEGTWQLDS